MTEKGGKEEGKEGGIGYMGARRHGQGGALPSRNVVMCIVVTVKRSGDEIFMHYFHNLSSDSGGIAPDPHWGSIPGPHRGILPRPLICQPLEKIMRAPVEG